MKQLLLSAACVAMGIAATAQKSKENIDKFCGCFEVSFKYAETFAPEKDYKYHDREIIAGVTELALPIVKTDKKVVIQHLLVLASGDVVKHWREEWVYEPAETWVFKGDKVWEKQKLNSADVKGKWMQTVWEVTDAPRYQGFAEWAVVNGKPVWENTTDAPLPRREYTKRSDYNILRRTNRLVLLPNGYDHIQENEKVLRKDGKDLVLVEERGLNRYIKLSDADCEDGRKYWEAHKGFWTLVQKEWDTLLSNKTKIAVQDKVEAKSIIGELFAQAEDWKTKKIDAGSAPAVIKATLAKYVQ